MPIIAEDTVVVDALFGSGLNRPLSGVYADVVRGIDTLENDVVAIDMPSGLMGEGNEPMQQMIVLATLTLTLQFPKLSLLLAENEPFVGELKVLDIGLSSEAIANTPSEFFFTISS